MRLFAVLMLCAAPALADEVQITPDMSAATVDTLSGPVTIQRNQDTTAVVDEEWARTSRPCPNFCVQPMQPAPGVATVGELEVIAALQDPGTIVVDSRTTDWFTKGTIPGAISIPYNRAVDELGQLGCFPDFEGWDCSEAKSVAMFCNGNWCGQSPTAIRAIIEAGFPAEKIMYYRGGMQAWRLLGLTVSGGE